MAQKNNLGSLLFATTTFLGGVALGILLAQNNSSKNQAWLSDHASELSEWMDRKRKIAAYQAGRKLRKWRKRTGWGVKQNVPDLYQATEQINLSHRHIPRA